MSPAFNSLPITRCPFPRMLLVGLALLLSFATALPGAALAADLGLVAIAHTYEVRIRLDGRVSTVRVQANDAGHAKKLVQAQFGDKATVLSAKRVD